MGFADLSIAEIAADYSVSVATVLSKCDQLGIAYKTSKTRLALEDAKAIISQILSQPHPNTDASVNEEVT
jgi:DNA-binding MurR/RpiR family transcriptional regulator